MRITVQSIAGRSGLRVALAVAFVACIVAGAALWWRNTAAPKAEPATKTVSADGTFQATESQLASFKIEAVSARSFRSERVTDGKIGVNLDRATQVFSPYSGRVTKVLATLGEQVKQGQPLLAVEATEFVQGQNDLIAAVAAENTSRAQLHQAEITENRKRALYDAKAGALQDWQQSQADLAAAQNNLRSARTSLNLVRNRLRILGKSDAEIASFESAQKLDSSATVLAPIGGTVTDRQVGPGQYIQSSSATPVYTIGNLSTLWLIANVRESDASQMRVGAPIEVRVLAIPSRIFKTRLNYVASGVDPNTRRLAVRAEINNADGALKPEMFASFNIMTGGESTAPAVPEEAVVYEGDSSRVWIVRDGGRIALRQVQTGRVSDGMVEIVKGLAAGELVVTSGTLFIDRAVKRTIEKTGN